MIESSQKIKSFLTFPGTAEEAVNFYVSLFPGAKILEMTRFVEGQFGEVGKVLNATFELKGSSSWPWIWIGPVWWILAGRYRCRWIAWTSRSSTPCSPAWRKGHGHDGA